MPEVGERKRRLRQRLAERRRAVPAGEARAAGEAVAAQLSAEPAFAGAQRVALYAADDGELPTDALAAAARAAGKPLLWPRVAASGGLEFARCAAQELVPGQRGIGEPPGERPAERLAAGDLAVLPGLAFDAAGGRLGRGGGHYDRSFPPGAADAPLLVGVAYHFQVVDAVPRAAHDRCVDLLVTERGVLRSAAPEDSR